MIPVVGCKVAVQPDLSWSFQCLGVTTILTIFEILGNLKSHGKHGITFSFTDNQWAHSQHQTGSSKCGKNFEIAEVNV